MKNKKVTSRIQTRTIVYSALLAALSIVLCRLLGFYVGPTVRIAFDKFPLFLAGLLFGPLVGGMVGFSADIIGAALTSGINPLICVTSIVYGVFGGIFRRLLAGKMTYIRLLLCYLLPTVLGSVVYMSAVFSFGENFWVNFFPTLGVRTLQFAVIAPLEVLALYFLFNAEIFNRIGIWPPKPKKKKENNDECN